VRPDRTAGLTGKGRIGNVLRSIQHPGGKVSVHYRCGDLEVMMVEVAGHNSLVDSTLWGRTSWHLVLDGQALFDVGTARWELTSEESLSLDTPTPYTIVNPSPARLRVLSVVTGGDGTERDEPR
jgi:hypothetical protein